MTGETTTKTPGTEGFKQTKIARWTKKKKKKKKLESDPKVIVETEEEIYNWMRI